MLLISLHRFSIPRGDNARTLAGPYLATARALLVILLFVFLAAAAARANGEDRTILIVGDSLSTAFGFDLDKSWVSLLKKRLENHNPAYRVVNASISGETTRGGAERIAALIAEHTPRIVLLELGGNDGLRGIGIDTTRQNLERIIDACVDAGAVVLLFAMELPPNYGQSYTAEFRNIYQTLGARDDVVLVPFFLDGVAGHATLMQDDGIHPRAEAQPRLMQNVWPYLEPELEG